MIQIRGASRRLLGALFTAALVACGGQPKPSFDPAPTSETVPVVPAVSRANDEPGLLNRVGALRAAPESLVVYVGRRVALDTIRVLLIGKQGETLGRLRNVRFSIESEIASLVARDTLLALQPGRAALRLTVPNDLLLGWAKLSNVLLLPIIVRE